MSDHPPASTPPPPPPTPPGKGRGGSPRGSITVHPLSPQADVIPGIPVDAETVRVLEESFALLAPNAGALTNAFYTRLFELHPPLRRMFSADIAVQEKKLVETLVAVIDGLKSPATLREKLRSLGQLHADRGVKNEQYAIVTTLLLDCMRQAAGAAWTPVYHREWERALIQISEVMISAGAKSAR